MERKENKRRSTVCYPHHTREKALVHNRKTSTSTQFLCQSKSTLQGNPVELSLHAALLWGPGYPTPLRHLRLPPLVPRQGQGHRRVVVRQGVLARRRHHSHRNQGRTLDYNLQEKQQKRLMIVESQLKPRSDLFTVVCLLFPVLLLTCTTKSMDAKYELPKRTSEVYPNSTNLPGMFVVLFVLYHIPISAQTRQNMSVSFHRILSSRTYISSSVIQTCTSGC